MCFSSVSEARVSRAVHSSLNLLQTQSHSAHYLTRRRCWGEGHTAPSRVGHAARPSAAVVRCCGHTQTPTWALNHRKSHGSLVFVRPAPASFCTCPAVPLLLSYRLIRVPQTYTSLILYLSCSPTPIILPPHTCSSYLYSPHSVPVLQSHSYHPTTSYVFLILLPPQRNL